MIKRDLCLILILLGNICGCVAPMARSSVIRKKGYLEIGGGPTVFNSVIVIEDTSIWWGGRLDDATYLGLQGNLRLGYGFSQHFGLDLTLCILGCTPLSRDFIFRRFEGWSHGSLALELRPWRSNDLFLCEIASPGILSFAWVHGWPTRRKERYSQMIEFGNTLPVALANGYSGEDFINSLLPSFCFITIARNFYFKKGRLSPNIALSIAVDRDKNTLKLGCIMVGLNWAPY